MCREESASRQASSVPVQQENLEKVKKLQAGPAGRAAAILIGTSATKFLARDATQGWSSARKRARLGKGTMSDSGPDSDHDPLLDVQHAPDAAIRVSALAPCLATPTSRLAGASLSKTSSHSSRAHPHLGSLRTRPSEPLEVRISQPRPPRAL